MRYLLIFALLAGCVEATPELCGVCEELPPPPADSGCVETIVEGDACVRPTGASCGDCSGRVLADAVASVEICVGTADVEIKRAPAACE